MNFDINHPITVVAILSVVLGFFTFFVKEIRFWMQASKKSAPSDRIVNKLEDISNHLEEIAVNVRRLREDFSYEIDLSKRKSDEILERVRTQHEGRTRGVS
jgi:predicted RND superfamily exporter protein